VIDNADATAGIVLGARLLETNQERLTMTMTRRWRVGVRLAAAAALLVATGTATEAQPSATAPPPFVKADATVKVSDHVWVIPDGNVPLVPNVGIIVGSRATLVIDTGLGPRNAETVLREVAKLSSHQELYLVATHFHPEHAAGASAFPPGSKFIASSVEAQDLKELGPGMIASFSRISPVHADLLRDVHMREPDVVFDDLYRLDLGDVQVQLMALGPTHTRGDTGAFVEPDHVLFAGDVVMNQAFLAFGAQSSATTWLKSLDRLAALHPVLVVPSHGPTGGPEIIDQQKQVLTELRAAVDARRAQGQTVDEAAAALTTEFQAKYPEWRSPARIAAAVRTMYAE
jgi:glyoxylase-like metal-dependent hydrolase (beta-lactamase superfamily II)